jgi:DNA repair exonuclease SbcCD nuclease subunit
MFEFLHAADIHLDSPLRGLQRYEGAPADAIRQASRHALKNLVELAVRDRIAFILIAGDLYDGDWRDYNTGLFLVQQMAKLRDANIPVVMLTGNHDAANKMTRLLRLPDNVKMLSVDEPETIELTDLGVAIHGQGFAQAKVTDDLSQRYPPRRSGCFNIGLLHTCATGADGHEHYAPCTLDGLRSKSYDYWALGHIHKREILCADPFIIFPGNLQGRHIRETGAKGCMRVCVNHNGQARAEFQSLDVLRWECCAVEADEHGSEDDVVVAVADELRRLRDEHEMPLAVRVQVTGRTMAHPRLTANPARWTNEIRARALTDFSERVWIEKVIWQTRPRHDDKLADGAAFAELTQLIGELKRKDDAWRDFLQECKEFEQLKTKLPPEVLEFGEALPLHDPVSLRAVLDQVESVLQRRLLPMEEPS